MEFWEVWVDCVFMDFEYNWDLRILLLVGINCFVNFFFRFVLLIYNGIEENWLVVKVYNCISR